MIQPSEVDDTIVAISTPGGRGALGVIRVSGPFARTIVSKYIRASSFLKSDQPFSLENWTRQVNDHPGIARYVVVIDSDGSVLDDGIAVFFKGPRSYTGEDTLELSLHGNPVLLRSITGLFAQEPGVRPAEPGEFTRRAFLNGKMDLTQAEAVRRVIEGRSIYEVQAARKNLSGDLKERTERLRDDLIELKAETEAEVDFSTEDLTFSSRQERVQKINSIVSDLEKFEQQSRNTNQMISGFRIALAGIPNAGKSSLMNRILGWDRAIVSETPGTTRDYLTEEIQIDGVAVRFIDTAGLRESIDPVESEGVKRTKEELKNSDLILHIIDGSIAPYDLSFDSDIPSGRMLHIINKLDQLHPFYQSMIQDSTGMKRADQPAVFRSSGDGSESIVLSCKENRGLELLHEEIHKRIFAQSGEEASPFLLEERQLYHVQRIKQSLLKVLELWEMEAPDEIAGIELDLALEHAGEISGRIDHEEILGKIFSTFCVGK